MQSPEPSQRNMKGGMKERQSKRVSEQARRDTVGRKFKFKSVSFQVQRSDDDDGGNGDDYVALKVITIEFYRRRGRCSSSKSSSYTIYYKGFCNWLPGSLIRIKLLASVYQAEMIKAKRAVKKIDS